MISINNKNNKLSEERNSITVTYPRTVSLIYGHYPYVEDIHNFLIEIKNNIDPEMQNYTNVKGGMTSWTHFLDKPIFNKFLTFVINRHQLTHPHLFQYFYDKNYMNDAWGNEIKTGDRLNYHVHHHYHGILYLTGGCDLILPELNIKITPQPGDYYIFPPHVSHGFEKYTGKDNRYSVVFNFDQRKGFDFERKENDYIQLQDKKKY
tara:strand:- start:217 stop:834 length:618 start_codon:yes stop_codon:yes gene_type:complete